MVAQKILIPETTGNQKIKEIKKEQVQLSESEPQDSLGSMEKDGI